MLLENWRRRYIGDDPKMQGLLARARTNADLAERIYALRAEAGLTQKQLAELVGTTRSVISRLEDADYEGHSLSMLTRIAVALGHSVRVEFRRTKARLMDRNARAGRIRETGKAKAS